MLVVYYTLTGNVRRFVKRLDMDSLELSKSNLLTQVNENYIVIAPTYDDEITDIISEFIDYKNNKQYLIGFVGSGNLNFDNNYVFNAKDLSKKYNKRLIYSFEYSGTDTDIANFKKEVLAIGIS